MKLMIQIGIVFGICLVGEGISAVLPFPFPSSVISMLLLFLLLLSVLKVEHIRQKAEFLLKNMSFFFVPAGVGIMGQFDVLRENLIPLLVILVVSTLLTFAATVYTVRAVIALQGRFRRRRLQKREGIEP